MKRKRNRKQQIPPSTQTIIERFLEKLDKIFQARQNNPNPPYPYDKDTNTIKLPKNIEQELSHLLVQGQKVEAVKRVTRLTGAGLRVSKDYVDALAKRLSS